MTKNKTIVVTSINYPTKGLKKISDCCQNWNLIVVADKKTPTDWEYDGITLLSTEEQESIKSEFIQKLPFNHYSRKNIGYLQAISEGSEIIAETDDDNVPYDNFLNNISRKIKGSLVQTEGWENVYRHFTSEHIWPRGYPLENINTSFRYTSKLKDGVLLDCPIQQYLADGDPDVDAIYRLTVESNIKFKSNSIILEKGIYCPFNSQNTIWFPEAYPLLYLPSFVSFRMTDIWRSFIAQICLYAAEQHICFKEATVWQERNEHSLIRDFKDEIPGYLHNTHIVKCLASLPLIADINKAGENLLRCYTALIKEGIIPQEELELVQLWLKEFE